MTDATGNLHVYDTRTSTLTTERFGSGGKPWGDAIPNGTYDILRHPDPDYFRLEPVDSAYGDDTDSRTGRDEFRLHRSGRTIGCIAAEDGDAWGKVRDLIRNTDATDVMFVKSKSRNLLKDRLEILTRYGTLSVVNSN